MDKVNSIIKMADYMMDNGIGIECRDRVNCIINLEDQHMMAGGIKINFMDMVNFIMNTLIT